AQGLEYGRASAAPNENRSRCEGQEAALASRQRGLRASAQDDPQQSARSAGAYSGTTEEAWRREHRPLRCRHYTVATRGNVCVGRVGALGERYAGRQLIHRRLNVNQGGQLSRRDFLIATLQKVCRGFPIDFVQIQTHA